MKRNVLSTLILIFLASGMTNLGHAFDLDETVDDEIRKNYNPSQLMKDVGIKESALEKNLEASTVKQIADENLPALPNITKQGSAIHKNNNTYVPEYTIPYKGGNIKIKQGTSFNVTNTTAISDWQREGTKVRFVSTVNTHTKNCTIPKGTVFYGEIIDSHQPQITCNGGLVVIRINSMIYKSQKVPVTAYVTRANDKKIFFNNIKGKRTYLKTTWKKGNWGRAIFNKMMTVTVGLGGDGATLILTPFPLAYGTLCLGLNTITSPICAFFAKGEHISIPANSNFRIKLIDDIMVN